MLPKALKPRNKDLDLCWILISHQHFPPHPASRRLLLRPNVNCSASMPTKSDCVHAKEPEECVALRCCLTIPHGTKFPQICIPWMSKVDPPSYLPLGMVMVAPDPPVMGIMDTGTMDTAKACLQTYPRRCILPNPHTVPLEARIAGWERSHLPLEALLPTSRNTHTYPLRKRIPKRKDVHRCPLWASPSDRRERPTATPQAPLRRESPIAGGRSLPSGLAATEGAPLTPPTTPAQVSLDLLPLERPKISRLYNRETSAVPLRAFPHRRRLLGDLPMRTWNCTNDACLHSMQCTIQRTLRKKMWIPHGTFLGRVFGTNWNAGILEKQLGSALYQCFLDLEPVPDFLSRRPFLVALLR